MPWVGWAYSVCITSSITSLNLAAHIGHFSGPVPLDNVGYPMPLDEIEFGNCPPNWNWLSNLSYSSTTGLYAAEFAVGILDPKALILFSNALSSFVVIDSCIWFDYLFVGYLFLPSSSSFDFWSRLSLVTNWWQLWASLNRCERHSSIKQSLHW